LDYDEEGCLTSIKRDNGTTQTLAYEYAYGFDGGRRWRKDYDNNIWNWMPCGVACSAGDLAVLKSTIGGSNWTAQRLLVPGKRSPFLETSVPLRSLVGFPTIEIVSLGQVGDSGLPDRFGANRLPGGGANAYKFWDFAWLLDWLDESFPVWRREKTPYIMDQGRSSRFVFDQYDPCRYWDLYKPCINYGEGGLWPDGLPHVLYPYQQGTTFDYQGCTACCDATYLFGEYHRILNYSRPSCRSAYNNCANECYKTMQAVKSFILQDAFNAFSGFLPRR
jgi:hypothetical protein